MYAILCIHLKEKKLKLLLIFSRPPPWPWLSWQLCWRCPWAKWRAPSLASSSASTSRCKEMIDTHQMYSFNDKPGVTNTSSLKARDIDVTCLDKLRKLESSVKRSFIDHLKPYWLYIYVKNYRETAILSLYFIFVSLSLSTPSDSQQCPHPNFVHTTTSAPFALGKWRGQEKHGNSISLILILTHPLLDIVYPLRCGHIFCLFLSLSQVWSHLPPDLPGKSTQRGEQLPCLQARHSYLADEIMIKCKYTYKIQIQANWLCLYKYLLLRL